MSMTLIDLLITVQQAQADESKLRIILLRGNPASIKQQLTDLMLQVRALEAMTGKEHKANTDGRVN